jgi:cell division transport system permease protein
MKEPKRKKKLGGYPAIGVVISITLALLVIGLFGQLLIYSRGFEKYIRNNIRMQVYLKSNLTETHRLQIENKLLSIKYLNKDLEKPITFISKEEAAKKFIAETGEDFTKFMGENPLHDAYLVSIDPSYHSLTEIEKIKTEIQKMNGVFQVSFVETMIDAVNKNITKVGLFLLVLIIVLLATVAWLINNTLRLALFSQRFLIRSMQLVGAKQWFIQRPFLFRAAGYGLLSGILASALLLAFSNYFQRLIDDLVFLQNDYYQKLLMASLVGIGVSIGLISTWLAIKKYLRMSLDELY